MSGFSEEKLDRVSRLPKREQEKYLQEAWEGMSEAERRGFWGYLDDDLNVFSEQNAAKRKKKFRKYARTRPKRRSS